jgi:predicted transposase YbfD/YdcC
MQKPEDIQEDEIDKVHGRIEQRRYEVFNGEPMLNKWKKEWPYIRSIIRVTRKRNDSTTVSYYVCNRIMKAKEVAEYIRGHWYIENKLHNIKDRNYVEDRTPKRVNPHIFSYCIDISVNAFLLTALPAGKAWELQPLHLIPEKELQENWPTRSTELPRFKSFPEDPPPRAGSQYTPLEDRRINALNWNGYPASSIANCTGRSEAAINSRLRVLGQGGISPWWVYLSNA